MTDKEYKPLRMQFNELPIEALKEFETEIGYYSLALIGLRQTGTPEEEIALTASGTLIEFNGTFCVLTAGHVIAKFNEELIDFIGFTIAKYRNSFKINKDSLLMNYKWVRSCDTNGPDLGIIIIPSEYVGRFKAHKNFWNIGLRRNQALSREYRDVCFWALCGAPAIKCSFSEGKSGFKSTLSQHMGPWLSNKIEELSSDGFDYIDVIFDGTPDPDWPQDFCGLSGGGLWQVILEHDENTGKISCRQILLIGVSFYQFFDCPSRSRIRCHGINSIYDKIYEIL